MSDRRLTELGVDLALTYKILDRLNHPDWMEPEPVVPTALPGVDGERILDLREEDPVHFPEGVFLKGVAEHGVPDALISGVEQNDGVVKVRSDQLHRIGLHLLPLLSYGLLNGGSASSYIDISKNRAFSPVLFDRFKDTFSRVAEGCRGMAKGITPAFINPDGSPGSSFLELKLRAALIRILQHQGTAGSTQLSPLAPLFQMTSVTNDRQIGSALSGYDESPLIAPLTEKTGVAVTHMLTGIQPLIAAFTPRGADGKVEIFSSAHGISGEPLAFPGGHGQNFSVLEGCYRELFRMGKRFISLGNVDNLGNLPSPKEIAILALSGKEAGFDFSFRTPVDVKGGILVVDQRQRLACGDIGVSIDREELSSWEEKGLPVLFNCANGVFNLQKLLERLDTLKEELPLRVSLQDKDPGCYMQTEQVTWEVIGMLDDYFIFGVDKFDRFLASKLLLENLLTSGAIPLAECVGLDRELVLLGEKLHRGLSKKLQEEHGMVLIDGRWEPLGVEELLEQT